MVTMTAYMLLIIYFICTPLFFLLGTQNGLHPSLFFLHFILTIPCEVGRASWSKVT